MLNPYGSPVAGNRCLDSVSPVTREALVRCENWDQIAKLVEPA